MLLPANGGEHGAAGGTALTAQLLSMMTRRPKPITPSTNVEGPLGHMQSLGSFHRAAPDSAGRVTTKHRPALVDVPDDVLSHSGSMQSSIPATPVFKTARVQPRQAIRADQLTLGNEKTGTYKRPAMARAGHTLRTEVRNYQEE